MTQSKFIKDKYQIIKYGDGTYAVGVLIPYFWSWCHSRFPTYELALEELNKHILEIKKFKESMKSRVVYELEVEVENE